MFLTPVDSCLSQGRRMRQILSEPDCPGGVPRLLSRSQRGRAESLLERSRTWRRRQSAHRSAAVGGSGRRREVVGTIARTTLSARIPESDGRADRGRFLARPSRWRHRDRLCARHRRPDDRWRARGARPRSCRLPSESAQGARPRPGGSVDRQCLHHPRIPHRRSQRPNRPRDVRLARAGADGLDVAGVVESGPSAAWGFASRCVARNERRPCDCLLRSRARGAATASSSWRRRRAGT